MKIHVVRKEDRLSEVAEKYGVDKEVLLAANPQIENQNVLEPGTKLRIPTKGVRPVEVQQTGSHSSRSPFHEPVSPESMWAFQKHEVRSGETLWKIAQAYQVGLPELLMANPQIQDPDQINVGDIVYIPPKGWHPIPDPPPMAAPGHAAPGVPGVPSMPTPMFSKMHPMAPTASDMPAGMPQMPMPAGMPVPPFPMTPYGWHGSEGDQDMEEGNWMPVTVWIPYTPHFLAPSFSSHSAYLRGVTNPPTAISGG